MQLSTIPLGAGNFSHILHCSQLESQFIAHCHNCKKKFDKEDQRYYCELLKRAFCYDCRDKFPCQNIQIKRKMLEHEHWCVSIEIDKPKKIRIIPFITAGLYFTKYILQYIKVI